MKLLERYIARTVLVSIIWVTFLLSGCQLFLLFIDQISDIGNGSYGVTQALFFGLLQMPQQVYLFYPMACLLGAMIGLGRLANHYELLVLRAAGVSIEQVFVAVFKAALVLIVIATIIGETVVPQLTYIANDHKIQTISNKQALRTSTGTWMRYQNDFINVGIVVSANKQLQKVYQFRFDKHHRLRIARKIESIDFINGVWQAHDIYETTLYNDHLDARHIDAITWNVLLKPLFLSVSSHYPEEMSLFELHQYLQTQKKSHQNVYNYQLAYFQRLLQPVACIVMILLAVPFIFGPLRSSTIGAKLVTGVMLGFLFQLIYRFLGPICQLYQWPVEFAALGPICFFTLIGAYLMRRGIRS